MTDLTDRPALTAGQGLQTRVHGDETTSLVLVTATTDTKTDTRTDTRTVVTEHPPSSIVRTLTAGDERQVPNIPTTNNNNNNNIVGVATKAGTRTNLSTGLTPGICC
jgi:hypothetical protein